MKKILPLIICLAFLFTSCFDETEDVSNENLKKGVAFLKANANEDGVITTASGLQYKVIVAGTGETPTLSDKVECNYEGKLINGTIFDSSYKRGEPRTFPVNGVIAGWTEALRLMKEKAEWQLFIPSNLAYGSRDMGTIGPNSTLIFKIELISIK